MSVWVSHRIDGQENFTDRDKMAEKREVWQGTLALMVLKTLEALGPLHGYGIARTH